MVAAIQGNRQDPLRKFQFQVQFHAIAGSTFSPPAETMGFSAVSGLRSETETVEYKEGDRSFRRKLPGMTTFDNIVLSRGVVPNNTGLATFLSTWRDRVIERSIGFPDDDLRLDVSVTLYDRRKTVPIKQWWGRACWPTVLEIEDLSGDASDVLIERLELACEEQEFRVP